MAGVHGGAPLHQDKHYLTLGRNEEGFLSGGMWKGFYYLRFIRVNSRILSHGLFGLSGYESHRLILVGAFPRVRPHQYHAICIDVYDNNHL